MINLKKISVTAQTLKIIAMVTMLIDHIGVVLFPDVAVLRIIGRIAFPIYAFLIGEGCRYTKNKWRYLRNILITAVVFQVVHFVVTKELKLCVLFGFALAVLFAIIYEWAKKNWNKWFWLPTLAAFAFFVLTIAIQVDYWFFTFFLPLIPFLIRRKWERLVLFGIVLLVLGFCFEYQFFGLFSLVPLALYGGEKGGGGLKWLFYIFFPLHYAVLGLIAAFIAN